MGIQICCSVAACWLEAVCIIDTSTQLCHTQFYSSISTGIFSSYQDQSFLSEEQIFSIINYLENLFFFCLPLHLFFHQLLPGGYDAYLRQLGGLSSLSNMDLIQSVRLYSLVISCWRYDDLFSPVLGVKSNFVSVTQAVKPIWNEMLGATLWHILKPHLLYLWLSCLSF